MAAAGADDGLVNARLAHEGLLAHAVLLGPALEVEVVQGAHDLPQVSLVGMSHVGGKPAQRLAHDAAVGEVERVFVVLGEKLVGLLRRGNHGASFG